MKKMKKVFSLIMILILVLSTGIPAQAAESVYTITIDNSSPGHTYEAYQIFTGDLSTTGVLSNIVWGSGVNGTTLLAALKADPTIGKDFTDCISAADVAAAMSDLTFDSEAARIIAQLVGTNLTTTIAGTSTSGSGSYSIAPLAAGYYLVKDKNGSLGIDSYTRYLLQVVNDVTVTPKSGVPTVTKKVDDVNDSTGAEDGIKWQDSADYDIGDNVSFKLTGTLPSNYLDYKIYTYIFHDTMSAGLTYNTNSLKAYVDEVEILSDKYTVSVTTEVDGSTKLQVMFENLRTVAFAANSVITIEYTATLNEYAVLGSVGNPNTVYLEYSNNPNGQSSGVPGGPSEPGEPGGPDETGNTPEDTVIVFTYKTIINKVDQNMAALAGAEFTLEKYLADGTWKVMSVTSVTPDTDPTTFSFSGLDDGIYRLTETVTPKGYNTIDPIYFTVTAEHEILSDDPKLTSLSANQSDENGTILITGILATFSTDTTYGSVSTNIVNNAGSLLPSTGGIGTTIFYIIGSVLMVCAAVFLVIKKKQATHLN